jgi:hypothetical protein
LYNDQDYSQLVRTIKAGERIQLKNWNRMKYRSSLNLMCEKIAANKRLLMGLVKNASGSDLVGSNIGAKDKRDKGKRYPMVSVKRRTKF